MAAIYILHYVWIISKHITYVYMSFSQMRHYIHQLSFCHNNVTVDNTFPPCCGGVQVGIQNKWNIDTDIGCKCMYVLIKNFSVISNLGLQLLYVHTSMYASMYICMWASWWRNRSPCRRACSCWKICCCLLPELFHPAVAGRRSQDLPARWWSRRPSRPGCAVAPRGLL